MTHAKAVGGAADEGRARVGDLLAAAAKAHAERIALVAGSEELDFATLDRRVSTLASALAGDLEGLHNNVAVAATLHPDFAVAYYGVARAGQTVTVVNPYLREEGLAFVLGLSAARIAFLDAGLAARLAAVRHRLPALRRVVVIGEEGDLTTFLAGASGTVSHAPVGTDDVACVHFTSGTTGTPKAVLLSHGNVVTNAAQVAQAQLLTSSSVTVNHLPTFHPMHLNSTVLTGATHVLCASSDPGDAVALANRYRASHFYSLPVRLARMTTELGGLAMPTVRWIASGGSALAPAAARALSEHFGARVFQGYGLAETSPLTHCDDPDSPTPGSVGKPVRGTECRVVDVETRAVLVAGQTGEVQVRGPQLMKGYLRSPADTGIGTDGWFSTGDVGRVDQDGRLFLVDRLKDVFKCDNFLVSPAEVEQALLAHPKVTDAAVVDLPDEFSGAVVGAVLVTEETDDVASITADVNDRLPYYQQVRDVVAVPEIPRSPNGKIQRHAIRAVLTDRTAEKGTPMSEARLFTVINAFTCKQDGDADAFESHFAQHVQWMRGQDGFHSHQAVRVTSKDGTYINIGRWRSAQAFQQVVASEVFQQHAKEFHELVDVSINPSAQVFTVGQDVPAGPAVVVETLTTYGDAVAFEQKLADHSASLLGVAGFQRAELSKSLPNPGTYTFITWWTDAEAARAVESGQPEAALRVAEQAEHLLSGHAG
ncbi:AMP-binding protein [Kitasatospora sp. NBC_01302]|uniref:AMP-binding protein n=1 Tax=Kitasatospora sp. NBC_01302 TaxID=2903575 RepID=UPI002E0EB36D|nr:AMP-binding protein [Kitasatospora sp. NBC_01302]